MGQPKSSNSLLVFANEDGKRYDFRKAFETAVKRAGIKDFHFHDCRHTFASYLAMSGISLYTIMALMGHKSMEMTQRYSHLSPDFQAKAVDTLDASITILSQSALLTDGDKFDRIASSMNLVELKKLGPVAQLVERFVRNEEASGSSPLRSTASPYQAPHQKKVRRLVAFVNFNQNPRLISGWRLFFCI